MNEIIAFLHFCIVDFALDKMHKNLLFKLKISMVSLLVRYGLIHEDAGFYSLYP